MSLGLKRRKNDQNTFSKEDYLMPDSSVLEFSKLENLIYSGGFDQKEHSFRLREILKFGCNVMVCLL